MLRERRARGGRLSPPWPADELERLAAAARELRGDDALAVLAGVDEPIGGDELRFNLTDHPQPLDFGTTTDLVARSLSGSVPAGFAELIDRQPALAGAAARALRGGVGERFAREGGDPLRRLLLQLPAVLEAAAEPGGPGRWAWLADLLGGDLRFLSLADRFDSPPARAVVLLAVGSPAAWAPAQEALELWVETSERPDKQSLARLVDGSRALGPLFLLDLVARRPELSSTLCRSERASAWLRLDPEPRRELLRTLADDDPASAARALVGVGATDPHLANRVLRGQGELVARLDPGFREDHHRLYAWGATGDRAALEPAAEALSAILRTWAASKPAVERSRALPTLLDHPCLSPWLLGSLHERGLLEMEELFVVLVRDPRGPGSWGEDPFPWAPSDPLPEAVGERLVSWLCSSDEGHLRRLSGGPTGLSVTRLLELSALAWRRGQISVPVLLGLGASFGLGRAGPSWVAEALLRFVDALPEGGPRAAATAELLDLVQPELSFPSEAAVCEAVARALPAPLAAPFVDFAVTRTWAAQPGRAGALRERRSGAVLAEIKRSWRRRRPQRLRSLRAPLFHDDEAALAVAAGRELRGAIRAGLDPRWLVPTVLGVTRAQALERLRQEMVRQRLAPGPREATLEALDQGGHPHPAAVEASLRSAGVGSVLRRRILQEAAPALLPGLLEDALLDAVDRRAPRSRLLRRTIEAALAAFEDDPCSLARALSRVLSRASWAGDLRWLEGVVRAAGALGEETGELVEQLDELAEGGALPRSLRRSAAAAAAAIRSPAERAPRRRVGSARSALVEAWTG